MHPLSLSLAATALLCGVSLSGAGLLALGDKRLKPLLFAMVAFAAGALIAASLFHLLPEAFDQAGPTVAGLTVVAGFVSFFFLERLLHWRHCHKGHCDAHPYTALSLAGGAIHNFVDGVIIAGAFLVNVHTGITATLVILAHALPQELGDFAILVHGGYPYRKALLFNLLSSASSLLGAVTCYFGLVEHLQLVPYLMAFAAGNFLYVGSSDLVPELHKQVGLRKALIAMALFLLAVAVVAGIGEISGGHHY